jgi:uncharacterized protein YjiK
MTRSFERAAALAFAVLLAATACGGGASHAGKEARIAVSGTLAQYAFDAPSAQWLLSKRLREISGLATTEDGRVFGHGDEHAVIYELDYRAGRIVKSFGDESIHDDFEGIAIAGSDFYLMTSNGRIYLTHEGKDGERVAFTMAETGLGQLCELEGLAWDAGAAVLLLPCKLPRTSALAGRIAVFAFSPALARLVPNGGFEIDERELSERIGAEHFNPSSIEMSPGGVLLLAGRQHALAELDRQGHVVAAVRLAKAYHPQPEGVTLSAEGDLIVADEGGEGRGRLAVYRKRS